MLIGILAVVNFCLFSQDDSEPGKKFEVEVSVGMGELKPDSIYQRITGPDTLILQYASFYQLNHTSSGTEGEFKSLIPFNLSAHYLLGGDEFKFYLKAGVDYGAKSITSAKAYQVSWPDFNESHDYGFTDKISYLVPHLGIGIRYSAFDFYGALGLGSASYKHTEEYNYSEPGFSYDTSYDFELKGTAPAVIFGIKYRIPLKIGKTKLHAFLKLESMLLKISSLTGSKKTRGSSSNGQSFNETTDGTLYTFQWNPYRNEWFDYWDVFTSPDSGSNNLMRNFVEPGLELSGFRIMIGIGF